MIIMAGISLVAMLAVALAVYFALGSSQGSKLADAMRAAVNAGRLVTLSNDDAYSYYMQLRAVDPANKALTDVAPKVLPQLRSMGDEVFRKKAIVLAEPETASDWARASQIYSWAHALDPNDKQLETRWRFAEGESAKWQGRKDEAERGYSAAALISNTWALPQNSVGLLRSEGKRYSDAIPYFQRAINLQPDWEIPYNNMGTAYYYLKNYDTAEYWYKKAAEKNPNWARPHFWLGSIYEAKSLKPQALEEYRQALSLRNDGSSLNADEIQRRIQRLQR
jgi:tetratricopeptide (TPR) repeat protein